MSLPLSPTLSAYLSLSPSVSVLRFTPLATVSRTSTPSAPDPRRADRGTGLITGGRLTRALYTAACQCQCQCQRQCQRPACIPHPASVQLECALGVSESPRPATRRIAPCPCSRAFFRRPGSSFARSLAPRSTSSVLGAWPAQRPGPGPLSPPVLPSNSNRKSPSPSPSLARPPPPLPRAAQRCTKERAQNRSSPFPVPSPSPHARAGPDRRPNSQARAAAVLCCTKRMLCWFGTHSTGTVLCSAQLPPGARLR
ncbi:hypothetical protein C8Q78DRAFT_1042806 [Trametes maxima]|nr:hypothetical protein C8Q78DRAFT_1042806 [Trametes maxima]